MSKFKRDEWYPMRGGGERRVIAIDLPGKYPVAAHDRNGRVYTYTPDGHYRDNGTESKYDIMLPKAKPREIWVNEYGEGFGSLHETEHEADREARDHRIGPARLFREVLE